MDARRAVERIQQGDPQGLEVLVRRYQARAVRFVIGLVRPPQAHQIAPLSRA